MNDHLIAGVIPPPSPPPGGPTDMQLEEVFHQNASLVCAKAYIDLDDFLVAARTVLGRWGHD
jgi:hypothetical protein